MRVLDSPAECYSWHRETLSAGVARVVVPLLDKHGEQKSLTVQGRCHAYAELAVFLSYLHKVVKIST